MRSHATDNTQAAFDRFVPVTLLVTLDHDSSFEGLSLANVGRQVDLFDEDLALGGQIDGHDVDADAVFGHAFCRDCRRAQRFDTIGNHDNAFGGVFRKRSLSQFKRRL